MDSDQEFLIQIVKKWNPNTEPEFRDFRCGMCQKEVKEARHHVLDSDEYQVTVHLCDECEASSGILKGEWKPFWCDKCKTQLTRAYHVWNTEGGKLMETHLCKSCGAKGK